MGTDELTTDEVTHVPAFGDSGAGAQAWAEERIFASGDDFFAALLVNLRQAAVRIDAEYYIFDSDEFGSQFADELAEAAKRGVQVRLIVDCIGSPFWASTFGAKLSAAGVKVKFFHRLPWQSTTGGKDIGPIKVRLMGFFRKANRRNHRKTMVVDGINAWAGSMNVSAVHLQRLRGALAWRDTGVAVSGEAVGLLQLAFEQTWLPRRKRFQKRFRALRRPSSLLLLNNTVGQRRRNYQELLRRLQLAKKRIWITTAYFVPTLRIITALSEAAAKGVDVRILVPGKSDVFFMPWVASAFHFTLVHAGVRVFEYQPRVLHAKTLLIDDWATIGSSNFNHRSLLHDLEADIVVGKPQSIAALTEIYEKDLQDSKEITRESWRDRPLLSRLMGKFLLFFRHWL